MDPNTLKTIYEAQLDAQLMEDLTPPVDHSVAEQDHFRQLGHLRTTLGRAVACLPAPSSEGHQSPRG